MRFVSLADAEQMPYVRVPLLDWLCRGLRLDEAMHPLTLSPPGLYGEDAAGQNGAPLRLMVPWKYGFKALKVDRQDPLRATRSRSPSWKSSAENTAPPTSIPAVDHIRAGARHRTPHRRTFRRPTSRSTATPSRSALYAGHGSAQELLMNNRQICVLRPGAPSFCGIPRACRRPGLAGRTRWAPIRWKQLDARDRRDWTFRFLLLTLAVTPLRTITGWALAGRLRRMLVALFAFFYACLHFLTFAGFDHAFDPGAIGRRQAPLRRAGIAFVLMIPLAATSTRPRSAGWGRRWQTASSPIAIGIIACVHYFWLVKITAIQWPLLLRRRSSPRCG